MNGRFQTTRWSQVLTAGHSQSARGREALAELCKTYWHPLFCFIRRSGHDAEDARDLTQGFFAKILEKSYLREARPERGRFRSFLLAALEHYLANEWDRQQTLKRGGGREILSIDASSARQIEPREDLTPSESYEREWALEVLARALRGAREELSAGGDVHRFDELKIFLTGETPRPTYRQVAVKLGMSEAAVKVAVHRLRKRFGERLRSEIADTVPSPGEVEDEMRYLLQVLSRR
jgi:RNA polymerase sigma-70 factor (ECF subfamily)